MAIKRRWNGLFLVESTTGKQAVDLSKCFRSAMLYDADGNVIDYVVSDEYDKELDEKYQKLLAEVVTKTA